MMGPRQVEQGALFYEFSLDAHVPGDHLLRSIDRFVDLSAVRPELAPFYSSMGRPSVDPELMIRMLIVGYCFARPGPDSSTWPSCWMPSRAASSAGPWVTISRLSSCSTPSTWRSPNDVLSRSSITAIQGSQGGFKRLSQHGLCSFTEATRQAPLRAFSSPVFFVA